MKPQAYEALQKAKALFRDIKDDIPEQVTQAPEPIRKPRVVLLPPNAPKFDQHSMKEEHKKMEATSQPPKQIDKYVEMSVFQACEACVKKGITKPSAIAKETGKDVKQIYTGLWKIRQHKAKAKREAREAKKQTPTPLQQAKEWNKLAEKLPTAEEVWNREPTAYEDAHRVVLRSREEYEQEIVDLQMKVFDLEEQVKKYERYIATEALRKAYNV